MSSERDQKIVVQIYRYVTQTVTVGTNYETFTESEDFINKVLQEALDKAEGLPEDHWITEEGEKECTAVIHHKDGMAII